MNWTKFAWACFLYGAIGGDKVYKGIITNSNLLSKLRNSPKNLTISKIENGIIAGFLNKWSCRLKNTPQAASDIKSALVQIQPYINSIKGYTIRNSFLTSITINSQNNMDFGDVVAKCYSELDGCTQGFRATAVSKLLHLISPSVFVMWDNPILSHYKRIDKRINKTGQGYRLFHEKMQDMVMLVDKSFTSSGINPPAAKGEKFEAYLSRMLVFLPAKGAAKFVDEYNWVVITNDVHVPPAWRP